MKNFDLSGIKNELKNKFDKSYSGILLSWSNKNAQPFDSWLHENDYILKANGITLTTEHPADAFSELFLQINPKPLNFRLHRY